jgi:hypothetical protein
MILESLIYQPYPCSILTNSQDLVNAVRNELGTSVQIELAMRYGNSYVVY